MRWPAARALVGTALIVGGITPALAATYCAPDVIAHAGGNERYAPNSIAAFKDAAAKGAKILETDVRFDGSGTPRLSHDAPIPPDAARLADLLKVPASRYLLELKVNPNTAQWTRFNTVVNPHRTRVVVTSFDRPTLAEAKAYAHTTGWVDALGDRDPAEITPYGRLYLKHHWAITHSRLTRWRAAGLTIYGWTPDRVDVWRRFDSYNGRLAATITNKPGAYVTWAKQGCA